MRRLVRGGGLACVFALAGVGCAESSGARYGVGESDREDGSAQAVDAGLVGSQAGDAAAPETTGESADSQLFTKEVLAKKNYVFCVGQGLNVSVDEGVLADDEQGVRVTMGPHQTDRGHPLVLEGTGAFHYENASDGTRDRFRYVKRSAAGTVVHGDVVLSGLPLFPNVQMRQAPYGHGAYEFSGEDGLFSSRGCASAGQVTVAPATLKTKQQQTVQVHADGRLTYRPAATFWGTDEFTVDLQIGKGETVKKQLIRVLLNPSELHIDELRNAPGAAAFLEDQGDASMGGLFASQTGASVGGGGDVNGDGFDDLVIGSLGQGSLVFGAERLDSLQLTTLRSGSSRGVALRDRGNLKQPGWNDLGRYLTAAGDSDFDGDGLSDFAFGLPETLPGEGVAEIVLGAAMQPSVEGWMPLDGTRSAGGPGIAIVAEARQEDPPPIAETLVPVGDFNGDGLADFLVSAGPVEVTGAGPGAFIVYGKSANRAPVAGTPNGEQGVAIRLLQSSTGELAAAAAGDVDDDGHSDVLLHRDSPTSPQVVSLIRGAEADVGLTFEAEQSEVRFIRHGQIENNAFGAALAGDFDFNGDGWPDLAFGDPEFNGGAGRVYVVFGSRDPYPSEVSMHQVDSGDIAGMVLNGENEAAVGATLAALGDVNGDGKDDLLVGAPGTSEDDVGRVYVLYGGSDKKAGVADLRNDWRRGFALRGNAGDGLGGAISSAGDVNGDCFGDVIVGVPGQDAFGAAYVLLGGNFTDAVDSLGRRKQVASESPMDQIFVGGPGANTLTANSSGDVLLGCAGSDDFYVNGLELGRVRGGRGFDTLHLGVADGTLDLASLPPLRVRGIEAIRLHGHGDNTVILNRRVLRRLSSSLTHRLRISGDRGDRVLFEADGEECPTSGSWSLDLRGVTCEVVGERPGDAARGGSDLEDSGSVKAAAVPPEASSRRQRFAR